MVVDVLPRWERCLYTIGCVVSSTICMYSVFDEGERNRHKLVNAYFTPGWSWIGREKMRTVLLTMVDITGHCFTFGIKVVSLYLVLTAVVYLTALRGRSTLVWVLGLAMLFAGTICKNYSLVTLLDEPSLPLAFAALAAILVLFIATRTRLTSLRDLCYVVFALAFAVIIQRGSLLEFSGFYSYQQYAISLDLLWLKFISFSLEKIRYRESQASNLETKSSICGESTDCSSIDKHLNPLNSTNDPSTCTITNDCARLNTIARDPSFLDLLFYSFYTPTFLSGPPYDYCRFYKQVRASYSSFIITENVDILRQLIKLVLWFFCFEFQLHFIYYKVLGYNWHLFDKISTWGLLGIGYCHYSYFTLRYVITYGVGIQLSRFDGISPLPMPCCIHFVTSCTDLWRHFDVGLYIFFKTYVYIPLGGSKHGFLRKIMASFCCFLFIIYWHNASKGIVIWGLGNYLICQLESLALRVSNSDIGIRVRSKLSPANILRLRTILSYPLFHAMLVMMFFFFSDDQRGWTVFSKVVLKATWLSLATQFCLITCSIHTAFYLQELYKHRFKKHTG